VLASLYVSFLYNQGGLLVKWFRDTFAAADVPPLGTDMYEHLNAELPVAPTRLLVLPHFARPPHYAAETSGVIVGLKTDTTRGEILKAVLEGTTLFFMQGMDALHRLGMGATEFIASGGGAKSDCVLQIKADVLGVPFVRPCITEGGMLGAAMLAGLSTGLFKTAEEASRVFVRRKRVFEPDARRHAMYREKHLLYQQLYPSLKTILQQM